MKNHYKEPHMISTLLATKIEGVSFPVSIRMKAQAGGGGGACAIFVEEKNLMIIGLHLSIKKVLQNEQLGDLINFLEKHKEKQFIIAGDFNTSCSELSKKSEWFRKILSDPQLLTCPYYKIPFNIKMPTDLDHIFYSSGFKISSSKTIQGTSDHLALQIELK